MSKKPLVIMHNDPDLAPFVSRFEDNRNQKEKLFRELQVQLCEGMSKLEKQKIEYWNDLEDLLIRKNIIDSKDLSLSYNEGVIYLEGLKEEEILDNISLKDIIAKFIK